MANTEAYKNFLTQAKTAGLLNEFTPQELQTAFDYPEFGTSLLSLKQNYRNATTDEAKTLAHETANQLREKYSQMSAAKPAQKLSGGAYGGNNDFKDTLAKIESRSYEDWKQGDAYKELEADYALKGQKAMQDTLAQISARTGGIASSYAGGAAQGAYDTYMEALPGAAYDRYLGETDELYALLNAQKAADETEYSRMLDQLQLDRDAEALAYSRAQAADEQTYERNMLEREEARNTVDNMIAMGATLADIPADLLAKSGYGESYVNVGNADYIRRNTKTTASPVIEQEPAPAEPYTKKQQQNYLTIVEGLTKKAEADANYEPINYIRSIEKNHGADYYRNLIGDTLYNRLIEQMEQYSYGNREEPVVSDDYMGAIYSEMMSAEDPELWLIENAAYLTADELKTAKGWLA